VVVINETLAREHFPGEDPIGQWIASDRAAGPESTWYEIVGIVGDQQQTTPRDPARAEVFENARQDWERSNWVVVRTSAGADAVVPTIRATLRELDPLIPLADIRALHDVWRRSMAREQLVLVLLGVFAGVALLLAVVGVYGVTAQGLRRRTAEIGVRMALGAAAPDVVGLMLRQALGVVAAGLVVGLGAVLLLARGLRSLLYGVQPGDPGTLAAVAALLGGVALFASWLPARRASGVDPAISLREEQRPRR
jgi:predicted lysophospholipase L1 biosynthesis ABC-type transport system permease subunit